MSWNYQRSYRRIQEHLRGMQPIDISDLTKEMKLEQVVSENQCKRIYGVHVYALLTNFSHLASSIPEGDAYRKLIIAVHLYQKEVFRIVEQVFGGTCVHFQGPKLHALLYQPFHNKQALATRAVLLQLVLNDFVHNVFHEVFSRYRKTNLASGTDLGTVIATSNGLSNDRELLFIGSAANYAAKIIDSTDVSPYLTQRMFLALPSDLQALCHPVDTEFNFRVYSVDTPNCDALSRLLQTQGIRWEPGRVRPRLQQEKQRLSSASITTHAAARLTTLQELSVFNNRRVYAASLFADVSGFTRYIKQAEKTGTQSQALQLLHVIREEMACIVRQDFPGLRVQFQGDRVQALFVGEERTAAQRAIEAAVGLQSAMEGPIKDCLPQASSLHLAIGVDLGETLVSRLGVRNYRDPICLGQPVEHAAAFEEASEGGQIAISRRLRRSLPENIKLCFQRDREAHCYVATDLMTPLKPPSNAMSSPHDPDIKTPAKSHSHISRT